MAPLEEPSPTRHSTAMTRHIAIIGAGYSGTLLAVQLARRGQRVTLVERAAAPGLGVAYGTADRRHLLNVRAGNMSALADDPGHFARWLDARGVPDAAHHFAPRKSYGEYLRALLADTRAAAPALAVVAGEAVGLEANDGVRVTLADGRGIAADAAVLAIGNLPPGTPPGLGGVVASPRYLADPWAGSPTAGLADDDTVLLVGTGLTMIDAAVTLGEGFGGRIVALSRRGQLPQVHAAPGPAAPSRDGPPAGRLSAKVRDVRARAATIGWRAAVDELRPFTQRLWADADVSERARFLNHLRPWWDIHRHRIAPEVAARIETARAADRLAIVAGKLLGATETADGIAVDWRPRRSAAVERIVAQRIVNCTGPLQDLTRADEPLLAGLVARGAIRPDALRIGIDVDPAGRTLDRDGRANDRLWAIGPMTKGAWWEIVAVPDIRHQAQALAETLAAG